MDGRVDSEDEEEWECREPCDEEAEGREPYDGEDEDDERRVPWCGSENEAEGREPWGGAEEEGREPLDDPNYCSYLDQLNKEEYRLLCHH